MTALAAVFHRDGRPVERHRLAVVADTLRSFVVRSPQPGLPPRGKEPSAGAARGRAVREGPAPRMKEPWCDGPAGLVGLAETSYVAENALDDQPVSAGASLVLFDGLLEHRGDLIDALGIAPRQAAQQADSALFARAWERWGEDAALRVEGNFAAVIWAPRARVLTAVCSPLDAPPLYYAVDRRRVILATAPRAIFAWGDLARGVDDAVLASTMINDPGDGRATCYRGVSSLLPGEVLTVSPQAAGVRQYYDLAERARPVRLAADADYVDAAGELLRNAVESAMRATVQPAISLSGGLDSSALAVAALDILASRGDADRLVAITSMPEPLVALAGRAGEGPALSRRTAEETDRRVRALAAMYPALDVRFVDSGAVDFEQSLLRLLELSEMPMRSARHAQTLAFGHFAVQAGTPVVIDGIGGNNTLSHDGFVRLASLLLAGRLPSLLRESAGAPAGRRLGRFSPLLHYGFSRYLPRRTHGAARRLVQGRRGWPDYAAIHPDFARVHRVDERARASGYDPYSRGRASVRDALLSRWERQRRRHWWRGWERAVFTASGMQWRVPLCCRRMVEWCVGLPDDQYLRDGQSRRLMRRLMDGRLPSEILTVHARADWDWHPQELPAIRATLERWRGDPSVAERVDLERLLRVVDAAPTTGPITRRNYSDRYFLRHGVNHALAIGRFIRWAEGGGNWTQA